MPMAHRLPSTQASAHWPKMKREKHSLATDATCDTIWHRWLGSTRRAARSKPACAASLPASRYRPKTTEIRKLTRPPTSLPPQPKSEVASAPTPPDSSM